MSSSESSTQAAINKATQLGAVVDQPLHEGSQLLQGKVPVAGHEDKSLGHPIHPATVHWPIAFLSTTFSASLLTSLPSAYYPSAILPAQASMPAIAHYTAAAAVITAIPAIVTGLGEGYELIRNQYKIKGTWGKVMEDAWGMKDEGGRKVYMTVKHASMNDAVVALAGFNWYYGWKWPGVELPTTAKVLGGVALPALFYSAMLGGKLVYEYAVGVQRQGPSKEVKDEQARAAARGEL